jgi:hypothetical protein
MSVPPAVAGGSLLHSRSRSDYRSTRYRRWYCHSSRYGASSRQEQRNVKSKFHPSVGARWSLDLFSSPALWITIHFPQVSPSVFGFEHLAEFSLISDTTRLTWPTAFFQATDVEWNICCFLRRPAFLKALETSSWELVFNSKQPELLHRS